MRTFSLAILFCVFYCASIAQSRALVFQSDFGLKDGAVSAMKGVAYSVSPDLDIFDVTHEIQAYDIWEGAYRLNQVAQYWPSGTVFVSVVDPGVGSERRSIVLKTKSGHFFVTPDNGTLTLVAETLGVSEVRIIDESTNRLKNSDQSYTFHGRDVYAYTGARLAAGIISFQQVGSISSEALTKLPYEKSRFSSGKIEGSVDILDIQYGNVWTNIDKEIFEKLGIVPGTSVRVKISNNSKVLFNDLVTYGNTFSAVAVGEEVCYLNSLLKFSIGINQGDFAKQFHVGTGPRYKIVLTKE
jgi:S-adenosylmethionine hydrolase